ncbi:MAG: nuclear transport factor 2 family protein [Actinomycetota bacterium]|nr:nuclear transport factor 2 family protein [Actinomycetota bacterium]
MGANSDVVQQALGTIIMRDLSAAEAVVAQDFVWHIPGRSVIGGDAVGAAGWADKLHRLLGAGLRPQLLTMLEGDEQVAVLQRNVAEAGDHSLDVRVVNLFTVRDGKVSRLETFFGDQHAVEAFWNAVLVEA